MAIIRIYIKEEKFELRNWGSDWQKRYEFQIIILSGRYRGNLKEFSHYRAFPTLGKDLRIFQQDIVRRKKLRLFLYIILNMLKVSRLLTIGGCVKVSRILAAFPR